MPEIIPDTLLEEISIINTFAYQVKPIIILSLVLICFILPFHKRQLRGLERLFNKIAKQKKLALLFVATLTLLGNIAIAHFFYWPIPSMHDEFSYLLTADTFAHGKLTNPIHPLWEHFETFHVMRSPTRASKFPPAQGAFMAVGQVLTGEPIVGVWLSMALACALTCWMLQAWVPPRWALLGAILMIFNLGWFTYWSQSFWGGSVALIGGALVFGALRRIMRNPSVINSICFALGLAILANSRPFEGFVTTVPAVVVLFIWIISKKSPGLKISFQKIILPMATVLILTILMMAYYNYCITGSYFTLPYKAYESVYNNWSNFIWVTPETKTITYNHKEFGDFYNIWYPGTFNKNFNPNFNFSLALEKLKHLAIFFLNTPLCIFLIALFWAIKNWWVRFSLVTISLLLLAVLQVVVALTHYMSPAICLLYFIIIQCIRHVYLLKLRNKPFGKFVVWSLPLYYCLMIFSLLVNNVNPSLILGYDPLDTHRFNKYHWSFSRNNLINTLNKEEGKFLLLVNYAPSHVFHEEWVYNEADIDNAKIVWARSMGLEKDCNLAKYFKDRRIWAITVINGGVIEGTPDLELKNLCSEN